MDLVTDVKYGIVVDVSDEKTTICSGELLTTNSKFEKGTWLSFKKEGKELKDIKVVEDKSKFPQACVYNNQVFIMSKAAAPISIYQLNPSGAKWKYLAWSTEWNTIGDPQALFATLEKDKIFNVRLVYMPGQQPVFPFTKYLWKIVEIGNCFDNASLHQITRTPWNLEKQRFELERQEIWDFFTMFFRKS